MIVKHYNYFELLINPFQEADFSPGPLFMTDKRLKLVDFSYPLGNEGCTILSAKHIDEYINDLDYLKSVDCYIWTAVVMTFVLIIIQNIVINKSLSNFIDNLFCTFRMMVKAGKTKIKYLSLN